MFDVADWLERKFAEVKNSSAGAIIARRLDEILDDLRAELVSAAVPEAAPLPGPQ